MAYSNIKIWAVEFKSELDLWEKNLKGWATYPLSLVALDTQKKLKIILIKV